MQTEILYRPAHALAKVTLAPGEQLTAESGAMVGMSSNVEMSTSSGGLKKGLKRLFGGETFFRNTFEVSSGAGEVLLAPALCGDVVSLPVQGDGWFLQSSVYIASNEGVEIKTKLGGFKGFFSGAGVFVLKAEGMGEVIVGSFGGLEEVDVDGDLIVDTGHLAAWSASDQLSYSIRKASKGWISSFLSGEGLVAHFKGRGKVWIQTRNSDGFGQLLGKLLPPIKNG